jgi:NADH-quinone oxidoreductase subunit N
LTQATLAAVAVMHWLYFDGGFTIYGMQRMVVTDPLGHLLGVFATVSTMIALAYARPYAEHREILKGELFTLSLFALLGISVMLSANNFLIVYLGLELMSLSLYALTALRRDHADSTEAAMKYFVLGALASGFLLYGLSMMYGAAGSLDIPKVFEAIATGQINKAVLVFGVVFIVSGLAFKLGAVPFHMWIPDVYQGAPTAVTLLIAGAPKLAAFAITFRLLVEGMSGVAADWQQMLMFLAVASLVIGNLAAIAQSNLKRMLAYSTIGQIGFMLLGFTPTVVSNNTFSAANGYSSALFYLVSYVLTTLGTFGVIMLLSRRGFESEEIDDFKGLGQAQPLVCGGDGDLHVLAGRHPADGGLLRQAGRAAGAGFDQRCDLRVAGGGCRAAVAGRRVLLPAPREGDVLRRAHRNGPDRQLRRRARAALAQRRGRVALRHPARWADDGLRQRRAARAQDLTACRMKPPRRFAPAPRGGGQRLRAAGRR